MNLLFSCECIKNNEKQENKMKILYNKLCKILTNTTKNNDNVITIILDDKQKNITLITDNSYPNKYILIKLEHNNFIMMVNPLLYPPYYAPKIKLYLETHSIDKLIDSVLIHIRDSKYANIESLFDDMLDLAKTAKNNSDFLNDTYDKDEKCNLISEDKCL